MRWFEAHDAGRSPTLEVRAMKTATAVVRGGNLDRLEGDPGRFPAASLVKPVLGHLALALLPDLDEPLWSGITARHALSHTTGLPNWRPEGEELRPIRPPGERWGYSGEGFVLLQAAIERQAGRPITELAPQLVFSPLGMSDTRLDEPEEGLHGYRQLITTARDYGLFLAHVLGLDDERWQVQSRIDDQLAWGAGWGLETGSSCFAWQWGLNAAASHFVIGCPSTRDGVVVLTDDADHGREFYRRVVARELPGPHPSLEVEHNPTFLRLVT
jgi:CubicO group peptidase (beta-lactamase class C family)